VSGLPTIGCEAVVIGSRRRAQLAAPRERGELALQGEPAGQAPFGRCQDDERDFGERGVAQLRQGAMERFGFARHGGPMARRAHEVIRGRSSRGR
jgi:hypothetical protein